MFYTVSKGDKRIHGFFSQDQALQLARAWSNQLGEEVEVRRHGQLWRMIGIVTATVVFDRV